MMRKDFEGKWISHRYWNANGANVIIVAHEGGAKDYAAYIGALGGVLGGYVSEPTAIGWVLDHGDKIERELAEFLFPDFKAAGLEYRR